MNSTDHRALLALKKTLREKKLLEKYGLDRIGVFGSVARGEPANDVDILIEDVQDHRRLIHFRDELESLLQKKVDIVIEKFANPIILYRARQDLTYVSRD